MKIDKSTIHFIFLGYGSEYTLNPLYNYFKEANYNVVEIDFLRCDSWPEIIKDYKNLKSVLITSSHLLFDEETRSYFNWEPSPSLSPLELISYLDPIASVYYPHDLLDQLHDEEVPYLNFFDLILAPDDYLLKYNGLSRIEKVGYIKYLLKDKIHPKNTPIFLPSNIMKHLGNGVDSFYLKYKSLFDRGTSIKFPDWNHVHKFEETLRLKNIDIYPASFNAVNLMNNHDIVICQGLSSTVYEASLLGKKIIYIEDPELDSKDPKVHYSNIQNIHYTTVENFNKVELPKLQYSGKPILEPFDFEKAAESILSLVF